MKGDRPPLTWKARVCTLVFLTMVLMLSAGCSQPQIEPEATEAPAGEPDKATSPPEEKPEPTPAPSETVEVPAAEEEPTVRPTEVLEEPTEVPEPTVAPTTTPAPEVEAPLYGGELVAVGPLPLATCNPVSLVANSLVNAVLGNIYDPLVRANAAGELQPQLAQSWEVSEDGLSITWHLRDDVLWHDGEPFTSDDVAFTFEGPSGLASRRVLVTELADVETPDEHTAIFRLEEPSAAALFQAQAANALIVPEHIFGAEDWETGPHATCAQLPIGTGPFRAADYAPEERLVVERNPDWWGQEGDYWGTGQPYLDRMVFVPVAGWPARAECLESGACDITPLAFSDVPRFETMEGRNVHACAPGKTPTTFYAFNLRGDDMPWHDARVRQAIAYAIDRDELNERLYYGTGIPTSTFVPPGNFWYTDTVLPYEHDPDQANRLLDEAGFQPGEGGTRFEITLLRTGAPNVFDEYLQQALAEVGIRLNIELVDFDNQRIWEDKVIEQQAFEMTLFGFQGLGDPAEDVMSHYHSDNVDASFLGSYNLSGYVNEELDALWQEFATTYDVEARKEIMSQIQAIVTSDLPYLYLLSTQPQTGANTEEYAGFSTDCWEAGDLLRTVWWREGEPAP